MRDPRVQATELLLQERIPRHAAPIRAPTASIEMRVAARPLVTVPVRRYRSPHTSFPHAQFLSNGHYVTSVTNAGGGASVWRGRAVTRWRRDATRDADGQFIYLRDVRSGEVWSADVPADGAANLTTTTSPSRRIARPSAGATTSSRPSWTSPSPPRTTSKCGGWPSATTATRIREIDVTSYAEIVLAPPSRRPRAPGVRQALRRDRVPGTRAPRCSAAGAREATDGGGVGLPRS